MLRSFSFMVVLSLVVVGAGGCQEEDASALAQEESAALVPLPTSSTSMPSPCRYPRPSATVVPNTCSSYLLNHLIPYDCKHMVTITRAGATPGTFRTYGVCTDPGRVVWQIEGVVGGFGGLSTGWIASDLTALQSRFNDQAVAASAMPGRLDFGTSSGGFIAKCCPPPPTPGGMDPLVLIGVAKNIAAEQLQADAKLKSAGF